MDSLLCSPEINSFITHFPKIDSLKIPRRDRITKVVNVSLWHVFSVI